MVVLPATQGATPSRLGAPDAQVADRETAAPAPALVIETPSLGLAAALVPWDSESFGVPVAQVSRIEVVDVGAAEADMQGLPAWFARQGVDLAACRLHYARLRESAALERVGFRFIEMVYGMQIDPRRVAAVTDAPCAVQWRKAGEADRAALLSLATGAFATGRWNVDWTVGQLLGGRRYADWVMRSFDDPRHDVLCAIVDGETVGLFVIEGRNDGSVYWHLTAVAPPWQGRGFGRAMWTSMLNRHADGGSTRVETTISARNVPVVNLYARQGWRFVECQMTYHWTSDRWLGKGGQR